jgi:hypothetical protein
MAKQSRVYRAKRRIIKAHKKLGKRARAPHIPIALAVCALTDARFIYDAAKGGFTPSEMNNIQYRFTGTGDGVTGIDYSQIGKTYGKYGLAYGIHVLGTKFGVNKLLYKATFGYVGI